MASLEVDVSGAPSRFLTMSVDGYSPGRNKPGMCTRWVYYAINGTPNVTPLPYAVAAWTNAPAAHRHAVTDATVIPKGMVPVLGAASGPRWSGDKNYAYGDVVISTGQGTGLDTVVRCTDSLSGSGVIGDMTLRQRLAQTSRPLLGFLSSYGGWSLVSGSTNSNSGSSTDSAVTEEEEMRASGYVAPDSKGNIWVCNVLSGTKYNIIVNQSSVADAVSTMKKYRDAGIKVITTKQGPAMFRGLHDITNEVRNK